MAISTTTDINLAIVALNLQKNEYLLSDNVPPHTIIEWYGPDPQPSDDDLNNAFDALPDTRYQQQRRQEYPRITCLLYTSPSPRDVEESRMPSSA